MKDTRIIVCDPFFTTREFPNDESTICVMIMPFYVPELEDIYRNIVKPTVESLNIVCMRGDDIYSVSSIIEDLFGAICKAQFVIAEFTGRNPNVLYEAGIAHTIGKPVICITQNIEDVPFDFRHIRHICYQRSVTGFKKLEEALKKTILNLKKNGFCDFPRPLVNIVEKYNALTESLIEEQKRIPWMYQGIKERIIRQNKQFHAEISRLKKEVNPSEVETKDFFNEMEFCFVKSSEIDVDYYSETEEGKRIITIEHQKINDFYISKYPITNLKYQHFINSTGHSCPEDWEAGKIPIGKEDHPVTGVSWVDVICYCDWLSELANKKIRIPTEAEWLAATGYGLDKRRYPWGDFWGEELCNSLEYGLKKSTSIYHFNQKGESPFGCVDMIGNLWEWTSSKFQSTDSNDFEWKALRGGSFNSELKKSGSLIRTWSYPGYFLFTVDLGFRVVYTE